MLRCREYGWGGFACGCCSRRRWRIAGREKEGEKGFTPEYKEYKAVQKDEQGEEWEFSAREHDDDREVPFVVSHLGSASESRTVVAADEERIPLKMMHEKEAENEKEKEADKDKEKEADKRNSSSRNSWLPPYPSLSPGAGADNRNKAENLGV